MQFTLDVGVNKADLIKQYVNGLAHYFSSYEIDIRSINVYIFLCVWEDRCCFLRSDNIHDLWNGFWLYCMWFRLTLGSVLDNIQTNIVLEVLRDRCSKHRGLNI